MNIHDIRFEIKEVTPSGSFAGYGSVYSVLDQGDDIVEAGCFTDSLAEWQGKGALPAMLWQHKTDKPCGAYQKMVEDSHGLAVEGKLALKTQVGAEAYELLQMKAVTGLSIGFMTREDSYDQKTGVRTIKRADLWEVSLVTFPMNDAARIDSVKAINDITDIRTAERFLRESGLSRSAAVAFMSKAKAMVQREAEQQDEFTRILGAIQKRAAILNQSK